MVRWFVLVISIAWYASMMSFTTEELNAGFMSTILRNNYFHYFTGTNKLEKMSPTAGGTVTPPFTTNNRSFTYDKNGNLATDALRGTNLFYDRANLPFRVTGNNQIYAFGYNTADARIFKGNDNQAYYYLAGSVYDMKNDKWEHYPGGLVVHKNNSLNLIIKDHLTNTRAVVDVNDGCSGPTYEAQYDYYPYSKILRKQESPRSRFQSTDHETDLETGYNNRNARWYDDESFQFLQTDPVADVYPSLTPYNYVSRKPISFIDPTGMYETEADAEANRLSAMRLGYKVDDVYKSGKEYVFNISGFDIGDFATAKSRDFVEAAKDAFNQPVDPIRKALMSDQIWQLTYNRDFGRGYNASGALGEPPLNTFDIVTLGQGGSAMVKSFKTSTSLSTTAADLAAS